MNYWCTKSASLNTHSQPQFSARYESIYWKQQCQQINQIINKKSIPVCCTQGVPIALSGRDMIGIAKTGSGKTAAFIWPMLVHIMDQKELETGEGPIAVIVCPTRELCQQVRWSKTVRYFFVFQVTQVFWRILSVSFVSQIHAECKRFGKAYSLRSVAVYGGGSMWEQAKALQEGAEIVVCTPVRNNVYLLFSFWLQSQELPLNLFMFNRVASLTMLKRRPHLSREWHIWCLMRLIACLTWALVSLYLIKENPKCPQ